METDLLEALRERFADDHARTSQHHHDFAASNRIRARAICNRIKEHTGFVFRDSCVLDVGCAYGGFVVLAAGLGATAWGVEIDPRFLHYAELNAHGEPGDIHLVQGDFLSPATLKELPTNCDLALVNDVFEHIYNTSRVLAHLHHVLADGGRVVFTIPNGETPEFVAREGHLLRPGLTLVPPNLWHYAVRYFSAYYRPWSYFVSLFRTFGFEDVQLWNATPELSLDEMAQRLIPALAQADAEIRAAQYGQGITTTMLSALDDLRLQVKRDIERGDPEIVHWKYCVKFWQGCAVKTGPMAPEVEHFC